MKTQTLHIKNMVCPRCIKAVEDMFLELGYEVINVKLGEIKFVSEDGEVDHALISKELQKHGFELLEDEEVKIINRVKSLIIQLIHHSDEEALNENISEYIQNQLNKDYHQVSKIFSAKESITIEKYIILQKIEKVKELLTYGELTLSEIAHRLGYSSVSHLSRQFKQVTGLSPSEFKSRGDQPRKSLDEI
ncbi:MAG: AraC family transcriptional regulator [Bacteroidales bacterium]|nr:AraC family transcriptional regulator [Bacteroidales bacterium]